VFLENLSILYKDFLLGENVILKDGLSEELFKQVLQNAEAPASFGHYSQKILYPFVMALASVFENKLLLEYSKLQKNFARQ